MKTKIFFCLQSLFSVIIAFSQTVDATYLNPEFIDSGYKYLRFGNTSNFYAGFMWNDTRQSYGNGNDFSIFTYNNRDITFYTGVGNLIVFPTSGGNMGIGTVNPLDKLHVNGTIRGSIRHQNGYFTIFPYSSSYDDGSYVKAYYDGNNKRIEFANSDTATDYTRLRTGGLTIASKNPINSVNGFANKIEFENGGNAALVLNPGTADELMFGMHTNGNFYWGTGGSTATNPNYYSMYLDGNNGNLGIRGKLTSNEVKVKIGGWADYVFKKNYNLPTLDEVEKHIKEKGHLINIPSAKEVEANGIELGEMNKLLLEKIEELTLYMIQQQKKQAKMLKRIQLLEKDMPKVNFQ